MHPSRRRRPRLIPGLCFVFVGGLFALPSPAQIAMETVAEPVDQTSTVTEPEQVDTTTPDPAPRRPDRRDDLWRWVDGDYALRDLHDRAQDQGFTYTFLLGTMTQFNFRGGANTHNAHETGGRAFHIVEVDLDKLGILPGATIFARGIQSFNSGIQGDVGSLTPPYFLLGSNGDNEILLNKYWYRQRLFDDRLEFRLGKLLNFADLFDRNTYADNYVNSFMNRALVHNMTMPTSLALGAFVKFWPTDWLYMQAAAIDAEPDNDRNRRGTGGWHSAFHDGAHFRGYGEIGFAPHYLFKRALPGRYALGGWYDGAIKPVFRNTFGGLFATRLRNDDAGFYINVEQMLYKEQPDPKDQQGLGIFARYGYAPEEVNRIEHFWSVGAVYEGLFEHRDKDRLGFGVAQSILSDAYEREVDPLADRETVYELYYSIMVTPWLTITPDVQVITNPGGRNDARDALVGGLRIKLVF
jgi:porin